MFGLFSGCKHVVKYSGRSIEIGTVKGPVQVPIEIGGFAIKASLLQTAGSILQILDLLQFTGCQKIQELKKLQGIPPQTIADLIIRQDEDARAIAQLAIISMTATTSPENFEKVLADWIAATLPRAKKMEKGIKLPTSIETSRLEALQVKSKNMQEQIERLDHEIEGLKIHLSKIQADRGRLMEERDKLMMFMQDLTMRFPLKGVEIISAGRLQKQLPKAVSDFPYLSEAISRNKPFDVEKSVKILGEGA